jgi:ABC-type multidrug transport system ATPase subunit
MCANSPPPKTRTMSAKTLCYREVTYGFPNTSPLFRDLTCSFSTEEGAGRIYGVMGPSGVGKTTLCEIALGAQRPISGRIQLEPAEANMAYIPQKGVLFHELNIHDNISCLRHSKTLGDSFKPERVGTALASMGLDHLVSAGGSVSSLSGGESQRVMLARIQTVACDVLVLDEPCSFLDNRVKKSFLDELRKAVRAQHILALMVTHLWDEVRYVADEAVFLHRDRLGSVGVFKSPIMTAVERPPTIDALFAIHWPDCVVYEKSECPADVKSVFPLNAAYIGLFGRALDQEDGAPHLRPIRASWLAVDSGLSSLTATLAKQTLPGVREGRVYFDDGGAAVANPT